ncbi:MAG: hypothetical protein KAJ10_00360 [Thermodesulfovibrionia bacterium]|nr:hypothetical protein [Thermodesulfovibrionia bacterium]
MIDDVFVREYFYDLMDDMVNMCRSLDEGLWWEQKTAAHTIIAMENADGMSQGPPAGSRRYQNVCLRFGFLESLNSLS